ncbi:MAG: hypothetical protein Q7S56_04170 [Nanoarchaeota archaeon]|nr:hypothetical protein [Nanoarchaeota archaeon]
MTNIEDYTKIVEETRKRTLRKTAELREKFPNETFPSEEEIKKYNEAKLLKYHLKISERYYHVIIEEIEEKQEYTREDVMD